MLLKLLLATVCLQLAKNVVSDDMPLTYECSATDMAGINQCIIAEVANMKTFLTINNPAVPFDGNYCIDFWGRSFPPDIYGNCINFQYVDLSLTGKELITKQDVDLQTFSPLSWKRMGVKRSNEEALYEYKYYTEKCMHFLTIPKAIGFMASLRFVPTGLNNSPSIAIAMAYCCKPPGCFQPPTNLNEAVYFPQYSNGPLYRKPAGIYRGLGFYDDSSRFGRKQNCEYSESLDQVNGEYNRTFEHKCDTSPPNSGCNLGLQRNSSGGEITNRFICCSMSSTDDSYKSKFYNRSSGSPYAPLGEAILGVQLLRKKIQTVKDKCAGFVDPDKGSCFMYFNLTTSKVFDIGDRIYSERPTVYKNENIEMQFVYPDDNALIPYLYAECVYLNYSRCDESLYKFNVEKLLSMANLTGNYCFDNGTEHINQTIFACAIEMKLINSQIVVNSFPVQGLSRLNGFKNHECKNDDLTSITCLCRPDYINSIPCNDLKNFYNHYEELSKLIVRPVEQLYLFLKELKACKHNQTHNQLLNSINFQPNIMCHGSPDKDGKITKPNAVYFDEQVNSKIDFLTLFVCEQSARNSESTTTGCNCVFNGYRRVCCCKPNLHEKDV